MRQSTKIKSWTRKIFIALLAGFSLFGASAAGAQSVVLTDKGYVAGYANLLFRSFLGIPYAAAPIGNLRWKPPQAHAPWGIWPATVFGSVCPQVLSGVLLSANEDCLNLNVYTPAFGNNLPVMVFIHGGAFTFGAGSTYDPVILAQKANAIVVTLNYRLGPFGFLAHPALSAEAADQASGQYGLQDQQFALKWVQNNIANFGGNRDNVTVFGESAGGISICAQIASSKAAGLFHKAIVESGACTIGTIPLAEGETYGQQYAANIGCSTASCLRAKSVLTLLYNPPTQPSAIGPTWSPSFGGSGSVMPIAPRAALAFGIFNKVPVINGSNHDEFRLFTALQEIAQGYPITPAQYSAAATASLGPNAPLALAQYPVSNYSGANVAHATMLGDASFICGARTTDQLLVANGVTTYAYEFNDPNAPPPLIDIFMPLLAAHSTELQYIFRTAVTPLNFSQQGLSDQMIKYWKNFAATGNPNGAGLPAWPAYSTSGDQFQRFAPGAVSTITTFAADHKCGFWSTLGF
jgi:para-nitrobenzyl esterase